MITLALDPSTKSTGWAIYEDQTLTAHGCISASSSNLYNRIHKMIDELEKIIKENKVDNAIIEDVFPEDVHNNRSVFNALMYLQGFITDLLNTYKITFKFYTASEWRKKCGIHTGRGVRRDSLKPLDMAFVKNQFDISVNDDEADAICIGFAGAGGIVKKTITSSNEDEYDDFEFL